MLKHVLIVSNSGLLLYCKEFIKFIKNESQIAGLLTAVEKASTNNTGMQLSYIELTNVAVVIVSHQEAPVRCFLFLDIEDVRVFFVFLCAAFIASSLHAPSSSHCRAMILGALLRMSCCLASWKRILRSTRWLAFVCSAPRSTRSSERKSPKRCAPA